MTKKLMKYMNLSELLLIILGSLLVAISIALLLVPAKISNGGVSGIAMVMHHLLNLPTGMIMLAFNIPLFLIGIKHLGRRFGVKTILGILISALITDFLAETLKVPAITTEPILATFFGGLLLGAGLGLIFKAGGSTGGSDIVGSIIAKYSDISTGQAIMLIDVFIIMGAGFAFKNAELALWGFISLGVCSYTIDLILEGTSFTKVVNIVTQRGDEITKRINSEMNRTATIIQCKGAYTDEDRLTVQVVLTRKELPIIKSIIKESDPDAFTYVSDVFAVMGKGFKARGSVF